MSVEPQVECEVGVHHYNKAVNQQRTSDWPLNGVPTFLAPVDEPVSGVDDLVAEKLGAELPVRHDFECPVNQVSEPLALAAGVRVLQRRSVDRPEVSRNRPARQSNCAVVFVLR